MQVPIECGELVQEPGIDSIGMQSIVRGAWGAVLLSMRV